MSRQAGHHVSNRAAAREFKQRAAKHEDSTLPPACASASPETSRALLEAMMPLLRSRTVRDQPLDDCSRDFEHAPVTLTA